MKTNAICSVMALKAIFKVSLRMLDKNSDELVFRHFNRISLVIRFFLTFPFSWSRDERTAGI